MESEGKTVEMVVMGGDMGSNGRLEMGSDGDTGDGE